jgi:hypothetical protein
MRKTLEITTGRHPFQVAIVAACPLSALLIIIGGVNPPSLERILGPQYVTLWLAVLVASGALTLVGIWWRHPLGWGIMVESGGLFGLATATTVYCTAIGIQSGLRGLASGMLIFAIAVACWWRALQAIRDVMRLHRAQADSVTHTVELLAEPGDGDRP